MRVVIQRVKEASVIINATENRSIGNGLLVFAGFETADTSDDIEWMIQKIIQLRIFSDEAGKMNLSMTDVNGEVMLISQFTLHASTKKGNRPSFIRSANPETAVPLYESMIKLIQDKGIKLVTGIFGADMQVSLINDGPVTIFIDTKNKE